VFTVARRPGDSRVPADHASAIPVLERPQRVAQAAVLGEQVHHGAADVGVPREPILPGCAIELLREGQRRGGGGTGGQRVAVRESAPRGGRPRSARTDEACERGGEVRDAVRGGAARHYVEQVVGAGSRGGGRIEAARLCVHRSQPQLAVV